MRVLFSVVYGNFLASSRKSLQNFIHPEFQKTLHPTLHTLQLLNSPVKKHTSCEDLCSAFNLWLKVESGVQSIECRVSWSGKTG